MGVISIFTNPSVKQEHLTLRSKAGCCAVNELVSRALFIGWCYDSIEIFVCQQINLILGGNSPRHAASEFAQRGVYSGITLRCRFGDTLASVCRVRAAVRRESAFATAHPTPAEFDLTDLKCHSSADSTRRCPYGAPTPVGAGARARPPFRRH